MNMKKKLLITLSFLIIATIAISTISMVSAKDITINNNTPGGLKQSIAQAKNGDIISLQKGYYTGENNTNLIIKKNITIQGLDSNVLLQNKENQIFEIEKAKVSLKNLKIKGSSSEHGDMGIGLIYLEKSNLTVSNCSFSDIIDCYTGAISSYSSNLVVNKCNFTKIIFAFELTDGKCKVSKSIFKNTETEAIISWKCNLTVSSCVFTKNNYRAISVVYGRLSVTGSTFKNNKAEFGPGISSDSCIVTVSKSTFKNNLATFYGGAIDSMDSFLTVKKSTFKNNHAKYDGGAIRTYFRKDSKVYFKSVKAIVSGSTFSNNKANKKGGAISNTNMPFKILDSKFTKNIAGKKYNAIAKDNKSKVTKKNVKISPKDGVKAK